MTRQEIPRFTLAAFFTAPKPCEDALLDLGNAYNKLADLVEEAWAENAERDRLIRRFLEWDALTALPDPLPAPFGDLHYWLAEFRRTASNQESRPE